MRLKVRYGALCLLSLLFQCVSLAQSPDVTVSGTVTDAETGEALIGVNIQADSSRLGATTDSYGRFALVLPESRIALRLSYLGYETRRLVLPVARDTLLQIALVPTVIALDSVYVTDEYDPIPATSASVLHLSPEEIKRLPALGGEVDVVKALQLMPGVQGGREGASGLYVRGGGPDQNLVLLDGTPIYNINHMLGFLSAFNPDIIRSVSLTKGPGSAQYGGRLSSVMDIALKEGNLQSRRTRGSVGVISSQVTTEGPLRKGKMAYVLSARRTYLDALFQLFRPPDDKYGYYFYDLVGKLSYVSRRHGVYASVYGGKDRFWTRYKEKIFLDATENYRGHLDWGNLTASLRWQGQLRPGLLANASVARTAYGLEFYERSVFTEPETNSSFSSISFISGIADWSARSDVQFVARRTYQLRLGGVATRHRFTPSSKRTVDEESAPGRPRERIATGEIERLHAVSGAAYAEGHMAPTDALALTLGFRFSTFFVDETGYAFPEPRFALRYRRGARTTLEASVTRATQFVHLLSRSGIGIPIDLWLPATGKVRPEEAWQVTVGGTHALHRRAIQLSADAYYKRMRHLVAPITGSTLVGIDAANWEKRVETGAGTAYGLELLVRKRTGRLTGWLGYALGRSTRRFANIDAGQAFPDRYDRRHNMAVTGAYRLSKRWLASATWVLATGNAIWLPAARVPAVEDFAGFRTDPYYDPAPDAYVYGSRHNAREPTYHRFDFAFRHTKTTGRKTRTWTLGLYNAYARKNPFFLTAKTQADGRVVYEQFSPFVMIPSISYGFSF